MITVEQADVLKWAAWYSGPKFHALLCDPPYHLITQDKRGINYTERMRHRNNPEYEKTLQRAGFMGKVWDGGDIAFQPSTWAALAEHLLPGAFGMAFASSRGWHRLAVAIEDAGLIIHPTIFLYAFGSGFPKSTRIERAFSNGNSPFCECGDSPQQFPVRVPGNNGHGGNGKVSNSQGDYQVYPRSGDERLLGGEVDALAVEPGLDDARKHSHSDEPLTDIQPGNEPSYNPSPVQYSAHPSNLDYFHPSETDGASQLLQVNKDETYPASSSIHANGNGNKKGADQPLDILASGTLAPRKRDNGNSVDTLHSYSYSTPVLVNHNHDTTNSPYCPECGKVKRGVWDEHRYGLQCLKPAVEPIIVFQKPYEGRPVECITSTGAGALWIEGGRVPSTPEYSHGKGNSEQKQSGEVYGWARCDTKYTRCDPSPSGRWPANFLLDSSAAERLDAQSGELHSGDLKPWHKANGIPSSTYAGGVDGSLNSQHGASYGDSGGASRFFFRYQEDALDEADPVKYCAKASRRERDAGLEGMPLKPSVYAPMGINDDDGIRARGRNPENQSRVMRNPHPTIKPIALARYLATLLLPPAEYAPRRILIPFCGAGSEMVGAMQAGWEEITGIEMEEEYVEIARARLEYWQAQPAQMRLSV